MTAKKTRKEKGKTQKKKSDKKVRKESKKKVKKETEKDKRAEKKKNENKHILKHKYNPKFELLSEEEVKEVLEKYNLRLIQLPKILSKDPVCKLFKAQVNDVFKITRKSYTAGESVYYRVVVNG